MVGSAKRSREAAGVIRLQRKVLPARQKEKLRTARIMKLKPEGLS